MAVKTGSGAQRQTAVARSVSDLGALMSAKAEAQAQPQPDIQVQAEVNVLPESNHNLTGAASATKEAVIQSTLPATAQNEQTLKEETTMAKNAITQAEVNPALAAAPALETNGASAAANVNATAEAPLSSSEVMGDDTTTTAPPSVHSELDKLLGTTTTTPDDIKSAEGLVSYLQGRDGRFKSLVEITKDTVKRVDEIEVKLAKLLEGGATRTVQIKTPDWKDQAVDGLVMGAAVGVGVLGVAYAFDAMFGTAPAPSAGEPAIQ